MMLIVITKQLLKYNFKNNIVKTIKIKLNRYIRTHLFNTKYGSNGEID